MVSINLVRSLVLAVMGSISLILVLSLKSCICFSKVGGDRLFGTNLGFKFEFENLVCIFDTADLVWRIRFNRLD